MGLARKGIAFLKSPQFKRMIIKFIRFGDSLPVWQRVFVRVVLGLLMMLGGFLFFLPFFGIWMLPLGVLMIGTCIPFFDRKILRWQKKVEAEIQSAEQQDADVVVDCQNSKQAK